VWSPAEEGKEHVQEEDMVRNEVLAYLRKAPQSSIHRLRAGDEVADAMNAFLSRLLGTDDMRELNTVVSETSAHELGRLLSWLMIVGYTLRSMEIRFSIEHSYALPHVALGDGGGGGWRAGDGP
jgi:Protein of unknown function (DUF760)